MPLILPGQSSGDGKTKLPTTSGSRLVLPGSPEAKKKQSHALTDREMAFEQRQSQAELSIPFSSRFLQELGYTGKDVLQGTARSFIATGQAITSGSLDEPFNPQTGFEKALVGDKPVSFKTIGEEYAPLLESAGVSKETTKKLSIPLGLFVGALDVYPGLPGKKKAAELAFKELAEFSAKTSDEVLLKTAIKEVVKGSDESIDALAKTLKDVDNADDARKLIDMSLKDGKISTNAAKIKLPTKSEILKQVPPELKVVADDIAAKGLTKEQFITNLSESLKKFDDPAREVAAQTMRKIDELGITPGRFFDVVKQGGSEGLDRVGREILNVAPAQRVTRTEAALLKDRIRTLARGAKAGSETARNEIFELQDLAIKYATDHLPMALRGQLLRTVRDANNPARLFKAIEKITSKIDSYAALTEARKALSGKQSKIGYLKKLGELEQTAIKDAKQTLKIDKPIRMMNSGQLDAMIKELGERLDFKRSEGMLSKAPVEGATKASDDFYKSFAPEAKSVKSDLIERGGNLATSIKEGSEDLLGVISTRLANIDKSLKYALRKFEFNVRTNTLKNYRVAKTFYDKAKKIPAEDLAKLDIAMKNGFIDDATELATKHGFKEEFEAVRTMLDDVYKRANEVGLEVEYRRNYFPRAFKKDKKSVRGILEYFGRNDPKGVVEQAFREASMKLGRPLADAEKVDVINTLMRGFRNQNVTLSKTGALKSRVIDVVTPELNEFYDNSFEAMNRYIEGTNNLIESRRFFGKHLDFKNLEPNAAMDDVIGAYVNNLISAGKISTEQQIELSRILKARFSGKEMAPWLGALKNVGYLSVMSSPINAITQIGDLAFTFYRSGMKGFGGLADAALGKGLKRSDLGIENIAAEFSSKSLLSKFVDKSFKAVGLDRVDRLGKESFINGTWRSLRQEAISSPMKATDRLKPIFGEETAQVIKELSKGEATENVKYLLFNELLDFQPVALSEVPLKYLEAPNGRIFYALKTYMIKTWDVYRREAFQLMKNPETRVQGAQNLMRLTSLLMLFNATADEIKDFITGKEDISMKDRIVDNLIKATGFSRYTTDLIGKEGLGKTIAGQILPPTQLADDLTKDFKDVFIDQDEDTEVSKLRSIRDIPVGGKLYYWWFGRGASTQKASTKGSSSDGLDIPSITIPSVEIPEIEIPTL